MLIKLSNNIILLKKLTGTYGAFRSMLISDVNVSIQCIIHLFYQRIFH